MIRKWPSLILWVTLAVAQVSLLHSTHWQQRMHQIIETTIWHLHLPEVCVSISYFLLPCPRYRHHCNNSKSNLTNNRNNLNTVIAKVKSLAHGQKPKLMWQSGRINTRHTYTMDLIYYSFTPLIYFVFCTRSICFRTIYRLQMVLGT